MRRKGSNHGFSMIELLVVVAIALLVAAISMPSLMTSYRSYRMGSVLRDFTNVVARARQEAVKRNRCINTLVRIGPNNNLYFGVDVNSDGLLELSSDNAQWMDPTVGRVIQPWVEPAAVLPSTVTLLAGNNANPLLGRTGAIAPGYLQQNLGVPDNFVIMFSQHGNTAPSLAGANPCLGGVGVLANNAPVPIGVMILQDTAGNLGMITVNPMGTVQGWRTTNAPGALNWHRQ